MLLSSRPLSTFSTTSTTTTTSSNINNNFQPIAPTSTLATTSNDNTVALPLTVEERCQKGLHTTSRKYEQGKFLGKVITSFFLKNFIQKFNLKKKTNVTNIFFLIFFFIFFKKGGFAKCYEFILIPSGEIYAAKIIDKATLTKQKTKQKVK